MEMASTIGVQRGPFHRRIVIAAVIAQTGDQVASRVAP